MPTEEAEVAHEEQFEIVVDTVPQLVHDATVTWTQVVNFAYPGQAENDKYVFKVQYEDAASHPSSGTLVKSDHVEVKRRGTTFSVIRSVVS